MLIDEDLKFNGHINECTQKTPTIQDHQFYKKCFSYEIANFLSNLPLVVEKEATYYYLLLLGVPNTIVSCIELTPPFHCSCATIDALAYGFVHFQLIHLKHILFYYNALTNHNLVKIYCCPTDVVPCQKIYSGICKQNKSSKKCLSVQTLASRTDEDKEVLNIAH